MTEVIKLSAGLLLIMLVGIGAWTVVKALWWEVRTWRPKPVPVPVSEHYPEEVQRDVQTLMQERKQANCDHKPVQSTMVAGTRPIARCRKCDKMLAVGHIQTNEVLSKYHKERAKHYRQQVKHYRRKAEDTDA